MLGDVCVLDGVFEMDALLCWFEGMRYVMSEDELC